MQRSILLHISLVTSDISVFSLIFYCLKVSQGKPLENHSKLSLKIPQNILNQFDFRQ
jgi:uncharacterized protein YcnI